MKQVSVDNLKENDILAFPILSHSGTVLIHADVALTDELIERAINLGVIHKRRKRGNCQGEYF